LVIVSRLLIPALLLVPVGPAEQQSASDHGSLVIIMGQEPSTPIPTLLGAKANIDVSDLLFLRLARPGRGLNTADEKSFEPMLARSWTRRDSLTIAFELDPRARWHDGMPVTSTDVVWSFNRMMDPTVDPARALLLRHLNRVNAEGDHRVVLRFSRAYSQQFYDAATQVQPLPAHLVDTIPANRFASSGFVQRPVGNGPYRWIRRESGRQLELRATPGFFLGEPKIDRVVILVVRDPDAQVNLMLDGTADALEAFPPVSGPPRLRANAPARLLALPSLSVVYLLFNQRAYGDRSRPHPILGDVDVRRALTMALDRTTIVRSTYGAYGQVANAPVPMAQWNHSLVTSAYSYDPAAARALLIRRGWADRDGDGILEKDGLPLALRLNVPPNALRLTMAPQVQEQFRRIGARLDIVRIDGPVWIERRNRGDFDLDFSAATMDPSPSGIVQSWTCAGRNGSNVGQYCNPAVDSLIESAIASTTGSERQWRAAYAALTRDAPAIFLAAPTTLFALHSRFRNVIIRPESFYSDVWRWSVDPSRRIARDGDR
jgi:peptide/nickel transport system substrate-binding protein